MVCHLIGSIYRLCQARIQDFLKGGGGDGQGGPLRGGIAPVGEKLLFEHTKFSATRGVGVITPTTPPPGSATVHVYICCML